MPTPCCSVSLLEPLERRVLLSGSPLAPEVAAAPVPGDQTPSMTLPREYAGAGTASQPLDIADSQESAAADGITISTPELPRIFLDTTYTPNTGGQTITVAAGGNLQAAINTAPPGDTILLQAGATFTGNFTLPDKSGSGWIIIRSSAPDSSLPAPGMRSYGGSMCRLSESNMTMMAFMVLPRKRVSGRLSVRQWSCKLVRSVRCAPFLCENPIEPVAGVV